MSFETKTKEEKLNEAAEIGGKLQEIVTNIGVDNLEKAIRFMSPHEREKLYEAVEISKTATDSLV